MNKLLLAIAVFSLSFNVCAFERPSREDVIKYFEATNTIELLKGYSQSYIKVLKKSYPKLDDNFYKDPKFIKTLDTYNKKILNESISIVRNNISKNDLNEIFKFMESELGLKLLKLNNVTDPLFNEAGTRTNIWLNEEVGHLLYKHGIR